jgi:hypothetical protein
MTRKLEETFNLPPMDLPQVKEEEIEEATNGYTMEEMKQVMERADKIDAALPQVSGLDQADKDYDDYATKSIETFDDLVELGKNVEDRHAAEIFNAASSMMTNALNAKNNKAQKKLEMIKLQISNDKLKHEREKLEYLKARHLNGGVEDTQETEGYIVTSRNDMLAEILAGMKKDKDT